MAAGYRMRRIRLKVSYDGTGYCGSQIQPNGVTVEEKLNEAVCRLTGKESPVIFASRTDAGVHARGNVCVFDTEMRMAADKFVFALNQRLPEDIRIQASDEVPEDWHPRKQNCIKTYEYRIFASKIPDPLMRLYSHFCYYALDIEKMRKAAAALIGEHDFQSFCSARSQAENTVRTILSADINEAPAGETGKMITLRITGTGFLYNMIRIIAGTLLQIGTGIRPVEDMAEIIRKRDRQAAGPVASAAGLTLVSIDFQPLVSPFISGENEDWSYVLDQRRTEAEGISCLTVHRCREADYASLLERVIHAAHRNSARVTLVRDEEQPERLSEGQRYGFYILKKLPADHPDAREYPFAAVDAGKISEEAE